MAFGLTTYVSRCRLPFTAQGLLPAAGQALPDGLSPAGLLRKVFNSPHVRWPPFPSFLAQSPELSAISKRSAIKRVLQRKTSQLRRPMPINRLMLKWKPHN